MKGFDARRTALVAVVLAGLAIVVIGLQPGARRASIQPGPSIPESVRVAEATPELAARAVDRLQLFRTGQGGTRLSLTAAEVTAMLRHSMPGVLPAGVTDPVVLLDGGRVLVRARLSSADFAGRAPLASVLGALQDTVEVDLEGRLDGAGDRLIFTVEGAHASRVPLPRGAVAAIASALARESPNTLLAPADGDGALGLRWPDGVSSVSVVGDRLVLNRSERTADRAVDGSDDT